MPPTFVYLMAFMAWVGAAIAVWLLAGMLAIFPSKRRSGIQLACAMAATFPGVIAYQVLAAPVIAFLILTASLLSKALEPGPVTTTSNPVVIAVSIVTVLLAFAVALAMSLAGFWEGWRLGWAFAAGQDLMSTLRNGPLFRTVYRVRMRVFRTGAT